jgi:uncharacterized membrane protein YphA (DoxX/SURF4 family)
MSMSDSLFKQTLAPLVLRLAVGAIFIVHGLEKVNHNMGTSWATDRWSLGELPEGVEENLRRLPLDDMQRLKVAWAKAEKGSLPEILESGTVQLIVAWGELLGGITLVLGLLTRLAALCLIVIQAGAIYIVTLDLGFAFEKGGEGLGFEFNVALIGVCLALVFMGAGSLSVDALLRGRRKPS